MKINYSRLFISSTVGFVFVVGPLRAATAGDPLAGMFATEAHFDGLINQNEAPSGARLLRTSRPAVGGGYTLRNFEGKTKDDSSSSKYTVSGPEYFLFGIMAFKNGVHLGFTHSNAEYKFKDDSVSVKLLSSKTALSVAAALKNGFGLGLAFEQNKDEIKFGLFGGDVSRDSTWGIIRPELYYAGSDFDAVLRYGPTMRHETGSVAAFTELEAEKVLSGGTHLLAKLKHSRDSETDDDEKNHFMARGGIRFLYDEQNSNVSAQLELEDAHAAGPRNGAAGNIAKTGVLVDLEHVAAPGHVVGGGVLYKIGSGKGSTFSNQSTKLSSTETAYAVSYSARF